MHQEHLSCPSCKRSHVVDFYACNKETKWPSVKSFRCKDCGFTSRNENDFSKKAVV